MFCIAAINFVEYFLLGIAIDHAWKYTVLDRIQYDAAIRFGRRLFVQFRT